MWLEGIFIGVRTHSLTLKLYQAPQRGIFPIAFRGQLVRYSSQPGDNITSELGIKRYLFLSHGPRCDADYWLSQFPRSGQEFHRVKPNRYESVGAFQDLTFERTISEHPAKPWITIRHPPFPFVCTQTRNTNSFPHSLHNPQ